jgi:hypothetical protein
MTTGENYKVVFAAFFDVVVSSVIDLTIDSLHHQLTSASAPK